MIRVFLSAIALLLASSVSLINADEDAIRGKLENAITVYDTQLVKYNDAVVSYLDSREAVARKKGDKEAVDFIKSERLEFETSDKPPSSLPRSVSSQLSSARSTLEAAYALAIRDYTKSGEDDKATTTEQQLQDFRNGSAVNLLRGDNLSQWIVTEAIASHWSVKGGVLSFDGEGKNVFDLTSKRAFRNFTLTCDWRIASKSDSGIYLRGIPQVQIWDHTQGLGKGIGSGGLYNNQTEPKNPSVIADNPVGQWNAMSVTLNGDRVTVRLNGKTVTDNVRMQNWPESNRPLPTEGPIVLQTFGSPIQFRHITIVTEK